MKIAVLSDIHGNILALKAVLEDITNQGIDKIYILGDLAFCGPCPNETINYIRENLKHAKIIQGNTDEMILMDKDKVDDIPSFKKEVMSAALKYSQDKLSEENKEFLSNLPAQIYEEVAGIKFLFVHGSPRRNDEGITQNINYSVLEEIVKDTEANIIFCGHTHYPIIHQLNKKTVVNVGSVGRPFEENPRSVYVIVDLSEASQRKFSIEHRYVKYDLERAASDLEQCEFEGANILAHMLRKATDKFPTDMELV